MKTGSNRKVDGPGIGKVTKGKGGSNRTLDGPGVGKPAAADNTSGMNPTASAGGKAHPSLGPGGSHESYKGAPKASELTSFNGKLNKVAEKW